MGVQNLALIYQSVWMILGRQKFYMNSMHDQSKTNILEIAIYNSRILSTEDKLIEIEEELKFITRDVVGRRNYNWSILKSGKTDTSTKGVGFLIRDT